MEIIIIAKYKTGICVRDPCIDTQLKRACLLYVHHYNNKRNSFSVFGKSIDHDA